MSQSPTPQVRKPDTHDILTAQEEAIMRLTVYLDAAEAMAAQNDGLRPEITIRCRQQIAHISKANGALYDQFHAAQKGTDDV